MFNEISTNKKLRQLWLMHYKYISMKSVKSARNKCNNVIGSTAVDK